MSWQNTMNTPCCNWIIGKVWGALKGEAGKRGQKEVEANLTINIQPCSVWVTPLYELVIPGKTNLISQHLYVIRYLFPSNLIFENEILPTISCHWFPMSWVRCCLQHEEVSLQQGESGPTTLG